MLMSRAQDADLRPRSEADAWLRKLLVMLAFAVSMAFVPAWPVLALSRHGAWSGHGGVHASVPSHAGAGHPHRASAALLRHPRPAKAHVVRHARPVLVPVHRGIVPLANTAWDNPQIPQAVASAIQTASSAADVDPHLLTALAWRESRFDPTALNGRSSARGLMQFTSGTWLQAMENFGAKHQAATYAGSIRKDARGSLAVSDERTRAAILQLRSDPVLSAALAADSMRTHREAMKQHLGRNVTLTDLYLLHVLGPTGAFHFIDAVAQRPTTSSQSVASLRTLRNAGLLARDGHPLTVANTYAAVRAMLAEQRQHSVQMLSTAVPDHGSTPPPIEVSEFP
jgi:hypothetical protein